MSRAFCVTLHIDDVMAACAKNKATISTVEPLHTGGTRVVLINSHDAAIMSRVFAGKLITGDVIRTPLRVR
ncbi:hypothetical protein HZF05_02200 [Sphingomonas sp. CGMCC 1.13654]|uniref:Uncharacterized protein n=1 Tax=Sphingomonas chungangi TaxID=2683589 RepID=A0A838L3B1_9SPHN|nr:hypothetical protein [Sphingomonas chungangi]MBA2932899.1 hypothetical protein [Sphingomonas chungangi]MVW56519.1 hypothetical protein [Sphingomonas chungangi]